MLVGGASVAVSDHLGLGLGYAVNAFDPQSGYTVFTLSYGKLWPSDAPRVLAP